MNSTVDQLLSNHFPSLAKFPELRDEILEISEVHAFQSGDVILREGQYIKVIPLLVSGLLKVYKEDLNGGEVLLYYIKSGESCVMSITAMMKGVQSSVKGVVEETAEILVVPAEAAISIAKKYPAWNTFMYDLFSAKYDELIHMITTLTFENKDVLVHEYLQNEAKLKGSNTLKITHQKIAKDLGSTREVVSRILKKLEHSGQVSLRQGEIEMLE